MSTSVPPELTAHHCGRCGMWHQGSLCPDMQQSPVTVIQGVDPQQHAGVITERDAARGENERLRRALRDIQSELSNGPTANWEYIEQRFREALGQ